MGSLSHPMMVSFCCKKKKNQDSNGHKAKIEYIKCLRYLKVAHTIVLSSLCIKPSVKILKNYNFGTEFFKITTKKFVMIVYFIVYCVNIMPHLQPLWALLICSSDACSAALHSRKEQRRYKVRQRKSHFSQCLISQETGSSCLPFSETARICYELNFQDTRCLSVIEKRG